MSGAHEPVGADVPPLTRMAGDLAAALRQACARLMFGVPGGGANLDVVGAAEAAGCRFVLTHTETAAAIMAGVAAELTDWPSSVLVTRGPGAASVVNGAAQALLDRQPILVVTDCVSDADRDRVSHQHLDQRAMLAPATKDSFTLGPESTRVIADVALLLATNGRPGPVHLDVDPSARLQPLRLRSRGAHATTTASVDAARAALRQSRRPVVVAGVGAMAAGHGTDRTAVLAALRGMVDRGNVPALTTYKGRGLIPDSSANMAGVATGATIEAPVLEEADLIVGVGLDPVELIPGAWPYAAPVLLLGRWEVDDSTFFGDRLVGEAAGDLGAILDELAGEVSTCWPAGTGRRHRQEADRRLLDAVPAAPAGLTPQEVVAIARRSAPAGTVATIDAGAHMLVAVPLWQVEEPGELLISSGLATMGFALPAAIAAALVRPGRHVVCFTGDGGLGMALAELETVARLRLKVVVVVFNDATLSLIAIKQRAEGHGGENAVRYAPTDFAAVAAGYGLASRRVDDAASYRVAMDEALAADGPTLLDVAVDPSGYPAVMDAIRGARQRTMAE
jgi:acetolactate synthase-1/2/3 large subunit